MTTQNYELKIIGKNESAIRFRIMKEEKHLLFSEVFALWRESDVFISFYRDALIDLGFEAFYWEHPALKKAYLGETYECILQKSSQLQLMPINETAFQAYLSLDTKAVDFLNLGKNARLVIPTKQSDYEIYNHLGKFLRMGEDTQIIAIFKRLGIVVKEELESGKTIWLNTAGDGVAWIHFRMDTRPKYYKTNRYKDAELLEKRTK